MPDKPEGQGQGQSRNAQGRLGGVHLPAGFLRGFPPVSARFFRPAPALLQAQGQTHYRRAVNIRAHGQPITARLLSFGAGLRVYRRAVMRARAHGLACIGAGRRGRTAHGRNEAGRHGAWRRGADGARRERREAGAKPARRTAGRGGTARSLSARKCTPKNPAGKILNQTYLFSILS